MSFAQCSSLQNDEMDLVKLRELCEGETVQIPSKAVDMTLELILAEGEGKVQWKRFVIAMCAQVSGVEDVSGFVRLLMDPSMFGNNDGEIHKVCPSHPCSLFSSDAGDAFQGIACL